MIVYLCIIVYLDYVDQYTYMYTVVIHYALLYRLYLMLSDNDSDPPTKRRKKFQASVKRHDISMTSDEGEQNSDSSYEELVLFLRNYVGQKGAAIVR